MHFEILIEDKSGKIILETITGKILGEDHACRIIPYKGVGHIPEDLSGKADLRGRLLLNKLPGLLRGYGKSLREFPSAVIVVVDLDNKDCLDFKQKLMDILNTCDPKPTTLFRIAIKEIEAWLLGDPDAIKMAYPRVREQILKGYVQDSVCGTWETLADAIYPGGSQSLKKKGYPHIGRLKSEWAGNIAPYLDPERNRSKSFQVFRDGLRNLAGIETYSARRGAPHDRI